MLAVFIFDFSGIAPMPSPWCSGIIRIIGRLECAGNDRDMQVLEEEATIGLYRRQGQMCLLCNAKPHRIRAAETSSACVSNGQCTFNPSLIDSSPGHCTAPMTPRSTIRFTSKNSVSCTLKANPLCCHSNEADNSVTNSTAIFFFYNGLEFVFSIFVFMGN